MSDKEIIFNFIEEKHIMDLGVISRDQRPHCAPLFYCFDRIHCGLLFQSDRQTEHAGALSLNPDCSGSIYDDIRDVSLLRGVQFRGIYLPSWNDPLLKNLYTENYPESRNIPAEFYFIKIVSFKMTDNTVSFGFKRRYSIDSGG